MLKESTLTPSVDDYRHTYTAPCSPVFPESMVKQVVKDWEVAAQTLKFNIKQIQFALK